MRAGPPQAGDPCAGLRSAQPAENFEHFRHEYSRACELYGLAGEVGAAKETDAHTGAWEVTTRGDGWQVETRYRLLRWDDLVRNDLARPPWWKIVQIYRTTGIALLNGAFGRLLRIDWRFALQRGGRHGRQI